MRCYLGPFTGCSCRPAATERDAFLVRVFLYVVFLAPLALVGLVADYARVTLGCRCGHLDWTGVARGRSRLCATTCESSSRCTC